MTFFNERVDDELLVDTLARLSVYTVPSDAKAYTALLPHFLPPRTALQHTLVMIVLDWTRPWTFVEELQTWLKWVEQWTKGDGEREVVIAREENRERCGCCFCRVEPNLERCVSTGTSTTLYRTVG